MNIEEGPNGSKATSEHQGRSALEITAAGPPIAGPEEKRRSPAMKYCIYITLSIGLLLLVILLPASVSSIEYHEYGLLKRKSTGTMILDKGVYTAGRYFNGPDYTFKKFKADAHVLKLDDLSVFSGDKLDSRLDITIIYFLKKDKLVELHNAYERAYEPVVTSRCIDAIKNTSPSYSTDFLFQNRTIVEEELFKAVKIRAESVFVDVTALYLARVGIPEEVGERQLNVASQSENNLREKFVQQGLLIRQETTRRVNEIDNKAEIVSEKASADAKFTEEKARAEAKAVVEEARVKGLKLLYDTLNITTAKDRATLDFIQAIEDNENANLYFNFDTLEVRTTGTAV